MYYNNTDKIRMEISRCYLTLAGILSKETARLNAFISIGRTLLLRQRYKEAKKLFAKVLNLTSERENRRERGLIFGYLAECYLGMNDKSKVYSLSSIFFSIL